MSYGDDVTLFVVGEGLWRTEVPPQVSATLALAELLDLAAAGRAGLDGQARVVPLDGPGPEDPDALDALDALRRWSETGSERSVARWLGHRSPGRLTSRLRRLADEGWVTLEVEEGLWSWAETTDPAETRRVVRRAVTAARGGAGNPAADPAFAVLVEMSGAVEQRLSGFRHRKTRELLRDVADRPVAGEDPESAILRAGLATLRAAKRRRALVADLRRTQDEQPVLRRSSGGRDSALDIGMLSDASHLP